MLDSNIYKEKKCRKGRRTYSKSGQKGKEFWRGGQGRQTKNMTLSQVLMDVRKLSMGVEKYSQPLFGIYRFEILISH